MIDYFGSGVLIATPVTDSFGASIATPSPVQFAILQDITVDDSKEVKELYGNLSYPVDVAGGKAKLQIKAKSALVVAELFNAVYYGQTLAAGYDALYNDQTGTGFTAGGPAIHITPTAPFGGTSTMVADLGVVDGNGVPYTRVASSPTSGQYALAAALTAGGVTYNFSDIDALKTVFINYGYSNGTNPAKGKLLTVNNIQMGYSPVFSAQFFQKRTDAAGNVHTFWRKFNACICTKLTMTYKNDDFTMTDIEISAFADANGVIEQISTQEQT